MYKLTNVLPENIFDASNIIYSANIRCNFPITQQQIAESKNQTLSAAIKLFSFLDCFKTELQALPSELVTISCFYNENISSENLHSNREKNMYVCMYLLEHY